MKLFIAITLMPIILFASIKNVKIKMSEAILIAQSKSAGRLAESSLELENKFFIYNITFLEPDRKILEIKIDANTGNILDIATKNE
ncbi:MAG: PepSY domain-containing protein [Bdellovibrio sp.]|nr:PepSY domain-containing protein [Bdellovibrio sp.]